MKILTSWLRSYLPQLPVDDTQLAEDLTLRGIAVEGIFPVGHASVYDMDITTNRVDAMNHYGVAREAAAIYDVPLAPLDQTLPDMATTDKPFPVRIEAEDLCGRFTARVLRGVTVKPTEGVVAEYFDALGLKKISNAVDVTNFVLLGMGHPTHAFDLDKIEGGIVIRRAMQGESLRLLDGTTRTLDAEDLVVADEVKALALAGVMGGYDSMITAETKNILVEAAWFSPASVRASSRRHLIHTDASHRFERGADFAACPVANALVCKEILASCGGGIEGELVDVVVPELAAATVGRPPVELALHQVHRHLGTTLAKEGITAELVERFLRALGCTLKPRAEQVYQVTLPSWRLDLTREIDLVEEIARVYGYNGFANTLPTPGTVVAHPTARAEAAVRQRLLALGYTEALSSTFASAADSALFAPGVSAVAMENPLSEEAANLRPALLSGMVEMLGQNLKRDVPQARLFETGALFAGSAEEVMESASLALGLTGGGRSGMYEAPDAGFYELKGVLESIVGLFEAPAPAFSGEDVPAIFEAGRGASVWLDGRRIAHLGQLAESEAMRRKLRQIVWIAELDLAALLTRALRRPMAREISRFQAVERDFSFTFRNEVTWSTVQAAIRGLNIAELTSLVPVELFRNEQKYPGVYSTLIRTRFQSLARTLVDEELAGWSGQIIAALQSLGGTLRS
jgi:phenylalanyl-tRNA synthetase beta chain